MTGPPVAPARPDADQRATGRLLGAGLGLLLLALVTGPLALLLHDRWLPLQSFDDAVSRRAEHLEEHVPGLLATARVLTRFGDPTVVTGLTLLTLVALLVLHRRRLALYVLVVRLGALVLSTGIKAAVGRVRPVFDVPVSSAFGLSFPSGHALGGSAFWLSTAVVLLPLVRARRTVLAAAVGLALLIAASRVLLGVHYLTDVVAGLVLGAGWTAVCTYVFAVWRREEGRPVRPATEGLEPALGP